MALKTFIGKEINNLGSPVDYSTTETPTGEKWVDGKPVYRRVYYNASGWSISSGWTYLFSTAGWDIETLIDARVFSHKSNNGKNLMGIAFQVSTDNKFSVYIPASWNGFHYAVLEYTKTTD